MRRKFPLSCSVVALPAPEAFVVTVTLTLFIGLSSLFGVFQIVRGCFHPAVAEPWA
jgi:hypothetical protein